MNYKRLTSVMAENGVGVTDIACAIGVDTKKLDSLLSDETLPIRTAFDIRDRMFPQYTVDWLFGKD